MNKILKTMLPIAGVACVAAPLVTMTSCNKHESVFVSATAEGKIAAPSTEVEFQLKKDKFKEGWKITIDEEFKPTIKASTKELDSVITGTDLLPQGEGKMNLIIWYSDEKFPTITEKDFISVTYKIKCVHGTDQYLIWESTETLKVVNTAK